MTSAIVRSVLTIPMTQFSLASSPSRGSRFLRMIAFLGPNVRVGHLVTEGWGRMGNARVVRLVDSSFQASESEYLLHESVRSTIYP